RLLPGRAWSQGEWTGDAQAEPGICEVAFLPDSDLDSHMRARAGRASYAAEAAADIVAQLLEHGGEQLRVLEAVAAAPTIKQLPLDRRRVDSWVLAQQHIDSREREGVHVSLVQLFEEREIGFIALDPDSSQVAVGVELLQVPG